MFWVGFVCMLFKHDLKSKKSQVNKSFFIKKCLKAQQNTLLVHLPKV